MKKELIGYVTGAFNDNSRLLETVKSMKNKDLEILVQTFNYSLTDLLDYISDFNEESTDVTENTSRYISRIQELEEEKVSVNKYVVEFLDRGVKNHAIISKLQIENDELRNANKNGDEELKKLVTVNKQMIDKGRKLLLENKEISLQVDCNKVTIDNLKKQIGPIWNEYSKEWEEPVSSVINRNKEVQELNSKLAEAENGIKQLSYENEELNKKISLEIICGKEFDEANQTIKNMMDNESRLNKRAENAELTAKGYESVTVKLAKENEELKANNIVWKKSWIDLRDQLNKLKGPQWKEDDK